MLFIPDIFDVFPDSSYNIIFIVLWRRSYKLNKNNLWDHVPFTLVSRVGFRFISYTPDNSEDSVAE